MPPAIVAFDHDDYLEHELDSVSSTEHDSADAAYASSILTGLSPEQRASVRATIIAMVLATDLKQHFDLLSNFQVRCSSLLFSMQGVSQRAFRRAPTWSPMHLAFPEKGAPLP